MSRNGRPLPAGIAQRTQIRAGGPLGWAQSAKRRGGARAGGSTRRPATQTAGRGGRGGGAEGCDSGTERERQNGHTIQPGSELGRLLCPELSELSPWQIALVHGNKDAMVVCVSFGTSTPSMSWPTRASTARLVPSRRTTMLAALAGALTITATLAGISQTGKPLSPLPVSCRASYLWLMDIVEFPSSRIVEIARLALGRPDTELLCFGESDQPSPESARQALMESLQAGSDKYSDVRGIAPLRIAIAHFLSALHAKPVAESRIQVTASGMAALNIALAAILRPGERVLVHDPIWPNIPNVVRLRGGLVDTIDLDRSPDGAFRLDLERLIARLPGARALILNSPNNPTGWTASHAEIAAILNGCRRHGVWLVADDVYSRLIYDGAAAAPSVLDHAEPNDRVMVVNSFSKTWAMTGWRLGWLVVPEGARERISEIVEVTHSTVAPFVQHAGIAALADSAFVAAFRNHCAQGRALIGEALRGLESVSYSPPAGAFYAFLGVAGLADSAELARRLVLDHGVAVAPGSAFGPAGEGHLRVCFAQRPERLARAMQRLRAGLADSAEAIAA